MGILLNQYLTKLNQIIKNLKHPCKSVCSVVRIATHPTPSKGGELNYIVLQIRIRWSKVSTLANSCPFNHTFFIIPEKERHNTFH